MAKATAAFPNSAPDLKRNPQIFEVWCEALQGMDGGQALAHLNLHIPTGNFFPTIAEIVRVDLQVGTDVDLLKIEYAHHEALQEEWYSRAVDPPAHVLERWGKR
jgi:hypothetical protein